MLVGEMVCINKCPKIVTSKQYPNKKPVINMTGWMTNQKAKLYNAVSEPKAVTQDIIAETLQGVRDTASSLYSRMMGNI